MSEQEKAIVRACLEQALLGLTEAREVRTWWTLLSEANRQAWKEFTAGVESYRVQLKE
jgi:hypothetical protein